MSKKALLMILDGWGIGNHSHADVIYNTPTPYWDYLLKTYPHSQLQASGENVGLPDGQMGNSEVGHLNIGAGRIVYQDLVKINKACADNSILQNKEIVSAFSYARDNGKNIHFMGLTSNEGYTVRWIICSSCATSPKNMVWKIRLSTASWTVVTPILAAVKDLSRSWRLIALNRPER